MLDLLLVPLMALINRARGGGLYAEHLPGHPRYYMTVVVAAVTFPFVGPIDAVVVALSWLAWAMLPWGRWYDLDRLPADFKKSEPNQFELLINRLPNDHLRFTTRNLIALLPAAVMISPFMLALALVQTLAYEIGWRTTPKTPTVTGEWITGAAWGAFLWWLT